MYIEQLYTNCLAEAAYYIEDNGEAAIIDPLRETAPYIELAQKRGAKIKYIFETHFHADFVSGHIDLANKTGATIVYGPNAFADYAIYVAEDGELFKLGNVNIELLHTPGHTTESSCFLLYNEQKQPYALFSGDTVFVGDVGRPDLAVKSDLSREDLAAMLYRSITQKILPLPDDVLLFPGHGAGSACGKNIGKETQSTIGQQKKLNYALQPMSEEDFVFAVTKGLETPPKYFFMDAAINKKGYAPIDEVMAKNTRPLSAVAFDSLALNGAIILDTRPHKTFVEGHVPNSINVSLDGQFAVWVGSLISPGQPIVLVTESGKEQESILRLARVGYENVSGYLEGGFEQWKEEGYKWENIVTVSPQWFADSFEEGENVIDVRNPSEWVDGTVKSSLKIPLAVLEEQLSTLNPKEYYYVYCKGGYRSVIACSIMKKNGFNYVVNIDGGYDALKGHNSGLIATESI